MNPGPALSITEPATPALAAHPAPEGRSARTRPSTTRALAEFLTLLAVCIVLSRGFVVEAFFVPTGSMSETLLGDHRNVICPNCATSFALGIDPDQQVGRAACPNCGHTRFVDALACDSGGDRLLVHKSYFDFFPPKRWEVVVFTNDEIPGQPFVKRVAGLPGERVAIADGDLWINDQIARKSIDEQRAVRQLVYDHDHKPLDHDRQPRWRFRHGAGARALPTRWRAADQTTANGTLGGFDRVLDPTDPAGAVDWIEYQHWQPGRQTIGPVRDLVAYDGTDTSGDFRVDDLMLEAEISVGEACRAVHARIDHGQTTFEIVLDIRAPSRSAVICNGVPESLVPRGPALRPSRTSQRLEVSTFDRRLLVALDGQLVFDPLDFERDDPSPPATLNHVALGWAGGSGKLRHLRVYRDIYYTSALAGSIQPAFGVEAPYQLGRGEYFMLGDNSPVSNDSRFWSTSPVVQASNLVGKPFLVHVPGTFMPLKLLGGQVIWIPDIRRIRYIR